MKRLLIILATTLSLSAGAQTTIKTNALYWAVLAPNIGVETRLGEHFTFNGEVVGLLWEKINERPYMGVQVIVGARYYPKQAFQGFYVGADAAFDAFKVSKWDHPAADVQHGVGMYYGLTLGCQISIGKRWNIDFYAGGGWHLGWYYATHYDTDVITAPWNKSGEWIPYKLGVTFAYRLSKK